MNSWLPSMRCPDCSAMRARDRHGLGQPEHRERERRRRERAPGLGVERRQRRRRKRRRQRARRRGSRRRPARISAIPEHAARDHRDDHVRECAARSASTAIAATSVTTPVAVTAGSSVANARADLRAASRRSSAPASIGMPKKFVSCAAMISSPAPAVKPDDDRVRDEVDQRAEPREPHRELRGAHHQRQRQRQRHVAARCPARRAAPATAKTTSDSAFVGPLTMCHDDPHSAATIAGTIARVQAVLAAASPASVAYATPCGSTTSPPIRPAIASALSVARVTRSRQARNGKQPVGERGQRRRTRATGRHHRPERAREAQARVQTARAGGDRRCRRAVRPECRDACARGASPPSPARRRRERGRRGVDARRDTRARRARRTRCGPPSDRAARACTIGHLRAEHEAGGEAAGDAGQRAQHHRRRFHRRRDQHVGAGRRSRTSRRAAARRRRDSATSGVSGPSTTAPGNAPCDAIDRSAAASLVDGNAGATVALRREQRDVAAPRRRARTRARACSARMSFFAARFGATLRLASASSRKRGLAGQVEERRVRQAALAAQPRVRRRRPAPAGPRARGCRGRVRSTVPSRASATARSARRTRLVRRVDDRQARDVEPGAVRRVANALARGRPASARGSRRTRRTARAAANRGRPGTRRRPRSAGSSRVRSTSFCRCGRGIIRASVSRPPLPVSMPPDGRRWRRADGIDGLARSATPFPSTARASRST